LDHGPSVILDLWNNGIAHEVKHGKVWHFEKDVNDLGIIDFVVT
jgi:hypothetical protein